MNKKIVIVNPALTPDQQGYIRQIAEEAGYNVVFCASNKEALPHMEDALAA